MNNRTTLSKHSTRRRWVAVLAASAVWCPTRALAQNHDGGSRSAAVDLFDAADRLIAAGRTSEACPKYAESYRLDPQLGVVLHLADCYERDGKLASAYAAFREAAELAQSKEDQRQSLAELRARQLESRLSRLAIVVPEASRLPELEVSRDGLMLASGSWNMPLPVDVGEHRIVARAPGYRAWEGVVRVLGEGSQEIQIPKLEAVPPNTAAAPAVPLVSVAPTASSHAVEQATPGAGAASGKRTLGYVLGGGGLLGLGVGTAFMIARGSALDERDRICPTGRCPAGTAATSQERIDALSANARRDTVLAAVSFGLGAGLAATGVVLVFTSPSTEQPQQASLRLQPFAGPRASGLVAQGTF